MSFFRWVIFVLCLQVSSLFLCCAMSCSGQDSLFYRLEVVPLKSRIEFEIWNFEKRSLLNYQSRTAKNNSSVLIDKQRSDIQEKLYNMVNDCRLSVVASVCHKRGGCDYDFSVFYNLFQLIKEENEIASNKLIKQEIKEIIKFANKEDERIFKDIDSDSLNIVALLYPMQQPLMVFNKSFANLLDGKKCCSNLAESCIAIFRPVTLPNLFDRYLFFGSKKVDIEVRRYTMYLLSALEVYLQKVEKEKIDTDKSLEDRITKVVDLFHLRDNKTKVD